MLILTLMISTDSIRMSETSKHNVSLSGFSERPSDGIWTWPSAEDETSPLEATWFVEIADSFILSADSRSEDLRYIYPYLDEIFSNATEFIRVLLECYQRNGLKDIVVRDISHAHLQLAGDSHHTGTEPDLQSGLTRVRWTCTCGRKLWDDFVELEPGGLLQLKAYLRAPSFLRSLFEFYEQRQSTRLEEGDMVSFELPDFASLSISGIVAPMAAAVLKTLKNRTRTPAEIARQSVLAQSGVTMNLGQANASNSTPVTVAVDDSQRITPIIPLELMLCIDSDQPGVQLMYADNLETVWHDKALFQKLRQQVLHRRDRLSRLFSFRCVTGVSLAGFSLDMRNYVDLRHHPVHCPPTECGCLPPETYIEPSKTAEYRCAPAKPKYAPAIGENYLMHMFSSPDCIHPCQSWVYKQLPKRICGRLMSNPERAVDGWGLYIKEGINWHKCRTCLLGIFVVGSLLFGIFWALFIKDVQTAFTISSYWVACGTIIVGYLATRQL